MSSSTDPLGPLHWHDSFGRKDGVSDVPLNGVADPPVGQCNRFSYAVSDDRGFVVAHCSNPLVTMSATRSVAYARLFAAAPDLLAACTAVLESLERNLDAQYLPETREVLRAAIAKAGDYTPGT